MTNVILRISSLRSSLFCERWTFWLQRSSILRISSLRRSLFRLQLGWVWDVGVMPPVVARGIWSGQVLASKMLGFVEDVFVYCAKDWGVEALIKELDWCQRESIFPRYNITVKSWIMKCPLQWVINYGVAYYLTSLGWIGKPRTTHALDWSIQVWL